MLLTSVPKRLLYLKWSDLFFLSLKLASLALRIADFFKVWLFQPAYLFAFSPVFLSIALFTEINTPVLLRRILTFVARQAKSLGISTQFTRCSRKTAVADTCPIATYIIHALGSNKNVNRRELYCKRALRSYNWLSGRNKKTVRHFNIECVKKVIVMGWIQWYTVFCSSTM